MAREIERAAERLSVAPVRAANAKTDNYAEPKSTKTEAKDEMLRFENAEAMNYTRNVLYESVGAEVDVDEIAAVIAERLKQAAFNM